MLMTIKDIVCYLCHASLEYDKIKDQWYIELEKGDTGSDVPNLHKFGNTQYMSDDEIKNFKATKVIFDTKQIESNGVKVHIEQNNGDIHIF